MSLQALKDSLVREGIIKIKNNDEEPFTLKSGKKSRFFFDVKEATLNPNILNSIVLNIVDYDNSPTYLTICSNSDTQSKVRNYYHENHRIGSVAIGGVPIATGLSLRTRIPQIIIRSEKHDRGTQSQVIGNCKDKYVLLIEDVATTGGSIVNAVKAIRDAGGICNHCIVVVDREEGAKENCNNNSISLCSLLKESDFGITENL